MQMKTDANAAWKRNANIFRCDDEFFIIDSEQLDDVHTKLFGYVIGEEGIIENACLPQISGSLRSRLGAFVFVRRSDGMITVEQDSLGSYGLCLFRDRDGYFALSNSFLYLADYLKGKYPLSINKDYVNSMIAWGMCSHAFSETMINEISLVDKDTRLLIDVSEKSLAFAPVEMSENSISPDSKEGMELLDDWFLRWTQLFRCLKQQTDNITVHLSGGFDSRVTFMLAAASGADLNDIHVFSIKDDLHTHTEDYDIASEIADHFHIALNNDKNISDEAVYLSSEDILNIGFYGKLFFHKEMHFANNAKYVKKRYCVTGAGGESIRAYWDVPAGRLAAEFSAGAYRYGNRIEETLSASVKKLTESAFRRIMDKHQIEDSESGDLPTLLYRETRSRNHCGRAHVEDYFTNTITLCPLLDPQLLKLRLLTPECGDKNLLYALMFARYCPELLNFRFEGGRTFDPQTLAYARELSGRYPRTALPSAENTQFILPADAAAAQQPGINNSPVPADFPDRFLKKVFLSRTFMKTITESLDDEIYFYARSSMEKASYYPLRNAYPLLAAVLAGETVENTQDRQADFAGFLCSFISKDAGFVTGYRERDIAERLRNDITARIDLLSQEPGSFEILNISDELAIIERPAWMKKKGSGCVILSNAFSLDIRLKKVSEGRLDLVLRSMDSRDVCGNKKQCWVDYVSFICSGASLLADRTPVSHDRPFRHSVRAADGENITLHLEWDIHRGTIPSDEDFQEMYKQILHSGTYRVGKLVTCLPKKLIRLIRP